MAFYGRTSITNPNLPATSGNREFKLDTFVYKTGTGLTIPTAIDTSLALATTVADHRGNVTSTDEVTITQTGWYEVKATLGMAAAAGSTTALRVGLSIGGVLATEPVAATYVQTLGVETSRTMLLTAAQVLSVWCQAVGANLVGADATLTVRYLGPSA